MKDESHALVHFMMKKIFSIMLISFISLAHSQNTAPATPLLTNDKNVYLNKNKPEFNISEANKTFDQLNLKLSTQNLNLVDLVHTIKILQRLNNQAQECIETSQKKINNANYLLQTAQSVQTTNDTNNDTIASNQTSPNTPSNSADQIYLQKELKRLNSHQAQCRLFTIRANEAITAYQSTAAELKKEETFSQSLPLWKFLPKFVHIWQTNHLFKEEAQFEISDFEWQNWLYHLFLSTLIASYVLWKFLHVAKLKKMFRLKGDYLFWFINLDLSLWMVLNWSWCHLHPNLIQENYHITQFFKILMLFFSLSFFNYFLFSIKRVRALFYWYGLDFKYFHHLIYAIITVLATLSMAKWLKVILSPSKPTLLAVQSCFMLIVLILCNYFVFRFCHKHAHYKWIKRHSKNLKAFSILYSSSCLIANIFGYHILGMRMLSSGLSNLGIIFIASLFFQALQKIYYLTQLPSMQSKIKYLFGYREGQSHTELLILKVSSQIIIIGVTIYFIGQNSGFISYYTDKLYAPILNGIVFSNFTIYPARILLGTIVFCGLFLFFRSISTAITRHYQYEHEEDTQVAIASILNYIGFALALIAGFLSAGFNFTGLAIVAGALSVGIGLGLQSIVNNFVSGLILLIEKPIKPGDRIIVDGVEGTVKKIRVRSTQIMTPAREDIIVPNSDLITRRVTNYMYTDKYLSISCQVQVAYNSNIDLVNELLLKAAYGHEDVIKTGRQKPSVLFKTFGDNALIFQLWCLIRDATKKSGIQSDLNYTILKLFNEHGVEMPVVQQTVVIHKN